MTRLTLGILLWSIAHFIPALAADFKKTMVSRYGDNPYKGVLGLLILISLYLIISGWKSMTPEAPDVAPLVFTVPDWGVYAASVLVLMGFVLFLAPYPPNNFKRVLRHPQLIGMLCWGVGHLLTVGTSRAVVLFGGLSIWVVIEMILINRRDGLWLKPEKVSFKSDFALVVFSIMVYGAFLYTHHMLFGGTPLT